MPSRTDAAKRGLDISFLTVDSASSSRCFFVCLWTKVVKDCIELEIILCETAQLFALLLIIKRLVNLRSRRGFRMNRNTARAVAQVTSIPADSFARTMTLRALSCSWYVAHGYIPAAVACSRSSHPL